MSKLNKICSTLFMVGLLPLSTSAVAQTYPEKVVKIVVPSGPGSTSDATARFLSDHLTKKFGKAFIVENRPGASGTIATAMVNRAEPDGHTLLLTFSSHYINQWSLKPDFDAMDFTPLAQLTKSPLVMSVGAESPYNSVEDVIKAAKAQPGKLTSASMGGVSQIAGAYFQEEAKIDITPILYKDATQSLLDTANGLADISFTGLTGALPLAQAGKMRIIGVSVGERDPFLPEVPTIKESGVLGYELASHVIVLAPKGVPENIIKLLSDSIGELASSKEFADLCKAKACTVEYLNSEALTAKFPQELEKWKRLVELAGLTAK